jgi:hypothetical protein
MTAEERLKALQAAVQWVLTDMAYKAPEQYAECLGLRWFPRLDEALKESQQ